MVETVHPQLKFDYRLIIRSTDNYIQNRRVKNPPKYLRSFGNNGTPTVIHLTSIHTYKIPPNRKLYTQQPVFLKGFIKDTTTKEEK